MKTRYVWCVVLVGLAAMACEGKKGETGAAGIPGLSGPAGEGTVVTLHEGVVPNNPINPFQTAFDVSVPELTIDSKITVLVSSDSLTWSDFGYNTFNLTTKSIHIVYGIDFIGWNYRMTVEN